MSKARQFASVAALALAMMLGLPGVAHAKQDRISGTVCTCGSWAHYDNARTKRHAGNIGLALTNGTSGTLSINLRNRAAHGTRPFSNTRHFRGTGTKNIAVGVRAHTTFYINARMTEIHGGDNSWAGLLTY